MPNFGDVSTRFWKTADSLYSLNGIKSVSAVDRYDRRGSLLLSSNRMNHAVINGKRSITDITMLKNEKE